MMSRCKFYQSSLHLFGNLSAWQCVVVILTLSSSDLLLVTNLNQSPAIHKETHKIGKLIVSFIIHLQEASQLKLPRTPIKFIFLKDNK